LIVECWTEGVRDSIIRFHNYVHEFAESAERMITHNKNIFSLMDKLALEDDESSIQETFKEIKSYVKKINPAEYYDFYTFVEGLDTKIEAIFSGKLKTLTKKFIYSMAN